MINGLREEIVSFKSTDINFIKEKTGMKNNTIRKIDWIDSRFPLLLLMASEHQFGKICIERTPDVRVFFRRIKDVTIFENYLIISWKEETKQTEMK